MITAESKVVDFAELDKLIKDATKIYIEANDRYENSTESDEKEVIQKFLIQFSSEARESALSTVQRADGAIEEIERFRSNRISIAMDVGLMCMEFNLLTHSYHLSTLSRFTNAFGAESPMLRSEDSSPLEIVHEGIENIENAQNALEQGRREFGEVAAQTAIEVSSVLELASHVLDMRSEMLSKFKSNHLQKTTSEALTEIRREALSGTKREAVSKLLEKFEEILNEVVSEVMYEELPWKKIAKYYKILKKAIGAREVDLSKGGLDILDNLLDRLNAEGLILEELNIVLDKARVTIEQLQAQTSTNTRDVAKEGPDT